MHTWDAQGPPRSLSRGWLGRKQLCSALTYLGSDLVATLANLNVHDFPHPSLEPKGQLGPRVWKRLGHQCELGAVSWSWWDQPTQLLSQLARGRVCLTASPQAYPAFHSQGKRGCFPLLNCAQSFPRYEGFLCVAGTQLAPLTDVVSTASELRWCQ